MPKKLCRNLILNRYVFSPPTPFCFFSCRDLLSFYINLQSLPPSSRFVFFTDEHAVSYCLLMHVATLALLPYFRMHLLISGLRLRASLINVPSS